jgi:hypothetical protein
MNFGTIGPFGTAIAAVGEAPGASSSPDMALQPGRAEVSPPADDADILFAALRWLGPMTDGAAMDVLGWGGTRTWQALQALAAKGAIAYEFGRAVPGLSLEVGGAVSDDNCLAHAQEAHDVEILDRIEAQRQEINADYWNHFKKL